MHIIPENSSESDYFEYNWHINKPLKTNIELSNVPRRTIFSRNVSSLLELLGQLRLD
jgi:hypothetical protein